jgi:hypothetical protein
VKTPGEHGLAVTVAGICVQGNGLHLPGVFVEVGVMPGGGEDIGVHGSGEQSIAVGVGYGVYTGVQGNGRQVIGVRVRVGRGVYVCGGTQGSSVQDAGVSEASFGVGTDVLVDGNGVCVG